MKRKLSLLFFLVFSFSAVFLSAQEVQFAMPYATPLNINPAFAGNAGCARITGAFNGKYIPGNPDVLFSTYHRNVSSLSFDQYSRLLKGGVGFNYVKETIRIRDDLNGDLYRVDKYHMGGIYSVLIPAFNNKWIICPSVEIGYETEVFKFVGPEPIMTKQYAIFWDGLEYEKQSYFDFSSGIIIYSKNIYAGLAIHHINQPELPPSFFRSIVPRKYVLNVGGNIGDMDAQKPFVISPSLIAIFQKTIHEYIYIPIQNQSMLFANCSIKYDKYLLGIGYNDLNRLVLSAGFRITPLHISYSYDFATSYITKKDNGAHEIALSFFFNHKRTVFSYRKFRTEEFFPFSTAAF